MKGRKRELRTAGGGGDATSGPGPGPYLAPPLFVAPQHCTSLHPRSPYVSLSVSLLSLTPNILLFVSLFSARPCGISACRLDDSVIGRRRGWEGRRTTPPFSPPWRRSGTCLSISSRAAASSRCGRVLKPDHGTETLQRRVWIIHLWMTGRTYVRLYEIVQRSSRRGLQLGIPSLNMNWSKFVERGKLS